MVTGTKPYRDYNSYLRNLFQCRVHKISLDAGLTCPNRDGTLGTSGCIYCNPRGSGTGAYSKGLSIQDQIRDAKSYLAARYKAKKFLAYFQSFTNTYAPLEKLRQIYSEALSDPDVVGLSIGTRPDCVPNAVLDYLQSLSQRYLIWLEYGLQSAHDATLRRIHRGHNVTQFVDAVERTRARNLPVCVHVILGLPEETLDQMIATAKFLSRLDIQGVKIHVLYVVRGTALERLYREGHYRCLTREEYVEACAAFLAHLPSHVIVQRVTGDPHPKELVAPSWTLEKQKNLQALLAHMDRKGLFQGKFCTLPQATSFPLPV
ncbi:TIGR01212 family radical SAM protein [Desulfosoma caldarium]|uniref:Radical SAM core domain-containing protein n=1 Tax=Desulfosoma caldarium TaxID=610254 RepID=A0A3N1VGL2_9BACT|nr:TIGR01212 family radical SAM protein [Desulfosoma caldarium]ROR01966.1 hypothetical protein EDC27_1163 [Desulfosoma caldarium]